MSTPFPENWFKVPPKNEEEIPEGIAIVRCDAGYKDGLTGICVSILLNGKQYEDLIVKGLSDGPVHAELRAIKVALVKINTIKRSMSYCLTYTDSKYAYNLVHGIWTPRKSYIQEVVTNIHQEEESLKLKGTSVLIIHTPGKHVKRIDKRAKKARLEEEERKVNQISERKSKVDQAILKGNNVKITIENLKYYAISSDGTTKYHVSINPPYCECQHWQSRWSKKPEMAILARALPCKHICALCEFLKKDVFLVFAKQIERID